MQRKLASIQEIIDIQPIDGADFISLAMVLGWQAVIKNTDFKIGDKVIYCEIDSILPEAPWSEFLKPNYRIKTKKLRGTLSQGLILPTSILPDPNLEIGTDVTEILGIQKYDAIIRQPNPNSACFGRTKGNFPTHLISKTDEIRLQSAPKVLTELTFPFYITVKVDGTSSTFCYDEGEFCACSRNFKKTDDEKCIYWKMAKKYKIADILKDTNYAIQGEIAGPGIQKNKLNLKEIDLFVFNVIDNITKTPLDLDSFVGFCSDNKLTTVPIIKTVNEFDLSIKSFLKEAEGLYDGTNNPREGIVVRPCKPMWSPCLKSWLSFKVLNNSFLLKFEGKEEVVEE